MTENSTGGKILPFAQNADFYARKGDERREKGALAEAAAYYKKAIAMEPQDPDFRILLGCLYGEMGCVRLSNLLLESAIWRGGRDDALLYYRMGANYLEYRMYDEAMACFQEMLGCDSVEDLQITQEVSDFLEEEGGETAEGQIRNQCNQYTMEAVDALGKGDNAKAIDLLEKAWALAPCSPEQACNLAMAYYCEKDYDRAMTVCARAMMEDPGSLQLHCVLALLYRAQENEAAAAREIAFLMQADVETIYEGLKVSTTLFDLGAVEETRSFLERILGERPYDIEVLHRAAVCCYNLGDHKKAGQYWQRALAIDPRDEVLLYYAEENRRALAGEPHSRRFASCASELPVEQSLRYVSALQAMQQEKVPSAREDWEKVLNWALRRTDQLRFAAVSLVAGTDAAEGERFIRTLLCDCSVGIDDKRMLLTLLLTLGVRESAVIFLRAGVADVRIGEFDEQEQLPAEYVQVPELFVKVLMEQKVSQEVIGTGIGIWQQFINAVFEKPVTITAEQVPAFSAALEYAAKKVLEIPVTQKAAAENFQTTLGRFRRAEQLLYEYVVKPLEDKEHESD